MSDIELTAVSVTSCSVLTQSCEESQRGDFTCPGSHSNTSNGDQTGSGTSTISLTAGSNRKLDEGNRNPLIWITRKWKHRHTNRVLFASILPTPYAKPGQKVSS